MSNDDLKSKYGRGNNYQQEQQNTNNVPTSEEEANYGRNKTFTKKTHTELTQKEKDIKENIANVISQYSQDRREPNIKSTQKILREENQESPLVRFIKGIIMACIVLTVACIIIALIAKPQIDFEGEQIIEQVKKSEDLYYSKMHKYHYFQKTNYDQTLGIDLSVYKFFTLCEVIPNAETGNYEVKLYGATNAFTMTYYYIKSLIFK